MGHERPSNEADDLRDAAREAHEAMKDLRSLMKEAEATIEAGRLELHNMIDEWMTAEVKRGIDAYNDEIMKATTEARQQVFDNFTRIEDLLLGRTKAQRKQNGASLDEVIEHAAGEADHETVRKIVDEAMKRGLVT